MKAKPDYVVVNFSGGKDSTAMLLGMLEKGERIDEVMNCDTYKEFPEMYRHIEKIKTLCESREIKFTTLQNPQTFDFLMFEKEIKRKNPELEGLKGYSWAGPRQRWCTARLKIDIIETYVRQLKEKYNVIQCIGIAADEQYRLERKGNQQEGQRYPLNEWGWNEKFCLQYCYDQGYDWGGLYTIFDRVSCWCCPLQSLEEFRKLYKHFPDLWAELLDMDRRTWRNILKDGISVEKLQKRFEFEEECQSQGKSIKSREFFKELKIRLEETNNE